MRVAINTRFWNEEYSEGYGNFTREICSRLVKTHPSTEFLFIGDRPPTYLDSLPSNVQFRQVNPPARHPLLWKYWYDWGVPGILKKYKADLFFSPDGFCSLTTSVPQCLVIHDLAFLQDPGYLSFSKRWYYRHYTPYMVRKASRIITVSAFSKEEIIRHYPVAAKKIEIIYNACSASFQPLPETDREKIRNDYASGCEYFIYVGSVHPRKNLLNLLKAFSWFKKRQRSNMKLLIAGRLAWGYQPFLELLHQFKFRDDVVMLGYVPQDKLPSLVAAAYALIYPSLYEGFGIPVLEAMQSAVPVIATKTGAVPEIAGDAVLYMDPSDPDQMGAQMALLYKDENLRKEFILKGLQRAKSFSWDQSSAKVWETFEQMIT